MKRLPYYLFSDIYTLVIMGQSIETTRKKIDKIHSPGKSPRVAAPRLYRYSDTDRYRTIDQSHVFPDIMKKLAEEVLQ